MSEPENNWSEYYKITKLRPASKLLIKALDFVNEKGHAIDIGAGALKDTKYLLQEGFEVTALDKSPLMKQEAENLADEKVHVAISAFEDFDFPETKYNIATAQFSLPFTDPNCFDLIFLKIKNSLKIEGIFCGQFFGKNDEWSNKKNMTFHSEVKLKELFSGFEILYFNEIEIDGYTANKTPKHWHFFEIIAKKR